VDYAEWAPHYERIRAEFHFPFDRERASADRLLTLLPVTPNSHPEGRLRARLAGRDAVVVGLAPHAGAPPVWKLPTRGIPPALVAADGATARCLDAGLVPDLVVTDLDGPVPSEVLANSRGAIVVVHAHGDNVAAVDRWVPEFSGEVVGSWAGPPEPGLMNVGGFTDGDRAAYLAQHFGASRILLWGFEFSSVEEAVPAQQARKLAKLRWARELLGILGDRTGIEMLSWSPDGRLSRYEAAEMGPSTQ
jgi:uncharacterized Rossmann fold enzyme